MTTENNHIDRLFKEKLGNFEQNPPAGLLARINEQVISEHKKTRILYLKRIASIAAAVALILTAGWFALDLNDNQVVRNEVTKPVRQDKPTVTTTPGRQPQEVVTALNSPVASMVEAKKVNAPASARQHTTAFQPTKNVSPAGQKEMSAPALPGTGDALAAAVPSGNQAGTKNQENKPSAEPGRKEPSNSRKPEPTRQENYSWNSVNPGAAPAATKADNSLKQWSLKAEIASTVTAMQHFSSDNPDSKSVGTIGGGMIASIRLSKKVTISSGIRYAQMKQGTHSTYTMTNTAGIIYLQPVEKKGNITRDVSLKLPPVSSIVYSNGMKTNPENTFVSDISQQFQYLEVPVQANYLLLDKKFTVGLTGGLSTNFLIGNKASITENGIKLSTGATSNLRDVIYAGSAGLELGYDLGKRMVLTVEPRVKQYLHSVSSNDLVNVKPLQFGIFTGISYSFE
jgi:hypothetical protein